MRKAVWLAVALLAPVVGGVAGAQDGAIPPIVKKYIELTYTVKEGYGFQSVHIGLSVAEAQRAWGAPVKKELGLPLLGSDYWYFQPDRLTQIRVKGRTRIEAIAVVGQRGSAYRTARGAAIGTPDYQLAQLYGKPAKVEGAVLDYPSRGVRFQIAKGTVQGFEVYPPRR
jgi:hypothetical protein